MPGKLSTWCIALAALVVGLAWSTAGASEGDAHYSRGVRAYFAGDSREAELYLSLAAELRPEDPRIYYFRALALQRQGRIDEARGDVVMGAALEAAYPQRYAVGQVLERVQGASRLRFEQLRQEVQREATIQGAELRLARREATIIDDRPYQRQIVTVSLDELLPTTGPQFEIEPAYPVEPPPNLPSAQPARLSSEFGAPGQLPDDESTGDPFVDDLVPEGQEELPSSDRSPFDEGFDFSAEAVEGDEHTTEPTPPDAFEDAFGAGEIAPFADF